VEDVPEFGRRKRRSRKRKEEEQEEEAQTGAQSDTERSCSGREGRGREGKRSGWGFGAGKRVIKRGRDKIKCQDVAGKDLANFGSTWAACRRQAPASIWGAGWALWAQLNGRR